MVGLEVNGLYAISSLQQVPHGYRKVTFFVLATQTVFWMKALKKKIQ
jgi:hypothetical protein